MKGPTRAALARRKACLFGRHAPPREAGTAVRRNSSYTRRRQKVTFSKKARNREWQWRNTDNVQEYDPICRALM